MAITLNVSFAAHAPATPGFWLKQSCHKHEIGTIHTLNIDASSATSTRPERLSAQVAKNTPFHKGVTDALRSAQHHT